MIAAVVLKVRACNKSWLSGSNITYCLIRQPQKKQNCHFDHLFIVLLQMSEPIWCMDTVNCQLRWYDNMEDSWLRMRERLSFSSPPHGYKLFSLWVWSNKLSVVMTIPFLTVGHQVRRVHGLCIKYVIPERGTWGTWQLQLTAWRHLASYYFVWPSQEWGVTSA